jgi:hypothetical protein
LYNVKNMALIINKSEELFVATMSWEDASQFPMGELVTVNDNWYELGKAVEDEDWGFKIPLSPHEPPNIIQPHHAFFTEDE